MEQQSNYKPGSVRGRVSDIRVLDEHGNVVEHFEGGDNTISSGASFDLLAWSFFPWSNSQNGTQARYTDANGYLFPNIWDLAGWIISGSSSSNNGAVNLIHSLFGQIMGIKGGTAGLSSHQTTLSNITPAWAWLVGLASANSDLQTPQTGVGYTPSSTYITYTTSSSVSNSGVPSITITITVNSTSSALAYTIDSLAWIPTVIGRSASVGTWTAANEYTGYWNLATASPLSFTSLSASTTAFAATNASAPAISTYVSALFVLPYTVTVNPGGAFQFSYTFQGA